MYTDKGTTSNITFLKRFFIFIFSLSLLLLVVFPTWISTNVFSFHSIFAMRSFLFSFLHHIEMSTHTPYTFICIFTYAMDEIPIFLSFFINWKPNVGEKISAEVNSMKSIRHQNFHLSSMMMVVNQSAFLIGFIRFSKLFETQMRLDIKIYGWLKWN